MRSTLFAVGGLVVLAAVFGLTFFVLHSLDAEPLPTIRVPTPEPVEDDPRDRPRPTPEPVEPAPGPEPAPVEPLAGAEPADPGPEPSPTPAGNTGSAAPAPVEPGPPVELATPEDSAGVGSRLGYVTLGGERVTWLTVSGELLFPGQRDGEGLHFSSDNEGTIHFPADLPLVGCEVVLRLGKGLAPRVPIEIPPLPVDIVIALEAYTIEGEVLYTNRGLEMATVRLVDTEDFEVVYDTQLTDGYGRFAFGPLFRGQYRIEADPPEGRDDLAGKAFNMHIGSNKSDVRVDLEEAGGLRGTLFDPQGQPVLQGRVVAMDINGIVPPGGSVEVFGDGTWELVNIEPGIYELTGYGAPPLAVKERAQVKTGESLVHNLQLSAGGSLRIIVENARAAPQEGATIFVTPMGLTPEPPVDWNAPKTGEDGVSLVTSLAPGDYFVTAEIGVRRAVSGMLRVDSGQTREVRLELPE